MTRGRTSGLEQALDGFAATAFALCVAWSLTLSGLVPGGAAAAAVLAGAATLWALRRLGGMRQQFAFVPVAAEWDEPVDDTLLLEDRLAEPEENSQVVRLFAVGGGRPSHLPGELAARIDHFLEGGRPALRAVPAQPDAAQELYEALADIRRNLR